MRVMLCTVYVHYVVIDRVESLDGRHFPLYTRLNMCSISFYSCVLFESSHWIEDVYICIQDLILNMEIIRSEFYVTRRCLRRLGSNKMSSTCQP